MTYNTGNNVKTLKKSDFLEFFTFIEKRCVSSNIVLVSGEKKSLFVFRQGQIIAHKSNVQREHRLEQLMSDIDTQWLPTVKGALENLTPFDQWAYLYNKNIIEESAYLALLNQDCEHIVLAHYKSEQTGLLKMPQIKDFNEHSLEVSPYNIIFEALKKDFKAVNVLEQYEHLNINVKKQDIFDMYLKNTHHQTLVYDAKKNIYSTEKPEPKLILDLSFLKEQQVLEFDVLSRSIQQRDSIKSEKDLVNKNAFEIFGLDETANGALIKKKYMEMVATYHPDKNGHLSDSQKKNMEKIFSQITLAYKKISTVEQRKDYIKELEKIEKRNKASLAAQRKVQAETSFLEGLAYMKDKGFSDAYKKFQESNSILPDEKYRVYAAWSQYQLGEEEQSRSTILQARESLKKETLKDMPMLEALFYLASIEKKLGYYKQARDYLQQVVDRDPYFMNAKIELNLINKRV